MNVEEETKKHIENVRKFLAEMQSALMERALNHDMSKLRSPEKEVLEEFTPKLAGVTYGSEQYKQFLKNMGPALEHHYAHNRHHPQFHQRGITGMNLADLVEALCDWKAATLRHDDGNILRSIDINAERFGISPQLVMILKNTIRDFGWGVRIDPDHDEAPPQTEEEKEEMDVRLRALGFLVPKEYSGD